MKHHRILTVSFALLLSAPLLAQAPRPDGHRGRYRVTITNLTVGQPFTPAFIVMHTEEFRLFDAGAAASAGVATIAEEGDTSLAMAETLGQPGVIDVQVAGAGPFMPGQSVSVEIEGNSARTRISVIGMLATTNDAFYGLNSERVSGTAPGITPQTFYIPAYDAGSERNTEDCDHIPGPPCNRMGVRVPDGAEGFITIHSGIHGSGDLPRNPFDWKNPVARVMIERIQ